jgi:hypothetical protein
MFDEEGHDHLVVSLTYDIEELFVYVVVFGI